jgi:hypothetical protein
MIHQNPDIYPSDVIQNLKNSGTYLKAMLPQLKQVFYLTN